MSEKPTEEELRRSFINFGIEFFRHNASSSNRDVVRHMDKSVQTLNTTVAESSTFLNRELQNLAKEMREAQTSAVKGLDMLTAAIRESSVSAEKQGARLNSLTKAYVVLTGCIVIATAIQVWLALNKP